MRKSKAPLDLLLGLEVYASSAEGIGGRVKVLEDDFVVEEIAEEGFRCSVEHPPRVEEGSGDYTWFVMVKRGLDTLSAIRKIARHLGVSSKKFAIAGLKDARAVTAQLVCAEGIPPGELLKFRDESGKVVITTAFRRPYKLYPGMLCGNRFRIAIRHVDLPPSEIERRIRKILEEVEEVGGFPAFYGYQRFGTIRPITHLVGKCVVKGEFERAVMMLLTEVFPAESERAKRAREYLRDTMDFKGALELFPKTLHHERAVLYHLARRPGDYAGAIRALPMAVRRLFVGAYQAYLFNRVLSKRMERGLPISRAVVGDVVAVLYRRGKAERVRSALRVNQSNVDKVNEFIARGDAVLALNVFGYDTVLCTGEPGEIEREILKEEEISVRDLAVRHMPELASRGTLRPASFRPEELRIASVEEDELNPGRYKVLLEFSLGRGMYATVLLRELMKPADVLEAGY